MTSQGITFHQPCRLSLLMPRNDIPPNVAAALARYASSRPWYFAAIFSVRPISVLVVTLTAAVVSGSAGFAASPWFASVMSLPAVVHCRVVPVCPISNHWNN